MAQRTVSIRGLMNYVIDSLPISLGVLIAYWTYRESVILVGLLVLDYSELGILLFFLLSNLVVVGVSAFAAKISINRSHPRYISIVVSFVTIAIILVKNFSVLLSVFEYGVVDGGGADLTIPWAAIRALFPSIAVVILLARQSEGS